MEGQKTKNPRKKLNFVIVKASFFNFSHDLALARNVANYTPPRNVQIMERDLASLVNLLPEAEMAYTEYAPVWGWDISFVHRLKCSDLKSQLSLPHRSRGSLMSEPASPTTDEPLATPLGLPTEEQLADIRRLSSRLTAVEMLPAIRQQLPEGSTVGESYFDLTISQFDHLTSLQFDNFILKALYSGSGRGLRVVESRESRVESLKDDVVIEPYYDKVADFALEYLATATEVEFLGVSVFDTNANNGYLGNYIAPQRELWQRIIKFVPHFDFEQLIGVVRDELRGRFVGHYLGPLGVDMMVVKVGEGLFVHPCVEVNVRRTMGELSLHMLPLLAEGAEGFFRIIFDKDSAALHQTVAAMPPAVCDDNGRLVSGTMLLTPLTADTHYVAVISSVA